MTEPAACRPHLLYVAFAFPPSTASSVYRCVAVPNEFAAAGWDVTVLTIHGDIWSEVSGRDDELLRSVDERIRVVRISDGGSEEAGRGDLRRFSKLRVVAPFLWNKLREYRSRAHFPERFHGLWLPVARAAARSIHDEHPVDLVMASASPYVSLEVARSIPGIPYVLDYRDAWAFHTFSGKENFSPRSRAGRIEASLLRGAAQIWFVNRQILEEYGRRYPFARARMREVPNGFDPQPGHQKPKIEPQERPVFGYLGTIPHVNTPLRPFFAGWRRAFGVGTDSTEPRALADIRGKLSSSGRVSADILDLFESMKKHGVEYRGPISKREVAAFYQSLDALILLLPGGKYVTGGKTAEYVATGLPIVSVHDLSNATTDLLRDYPLWFPAETLTEEGISRAFEAAYEYLQDPDQERADAAWEYGQTFLRSRMLMPVIAELADIARNHAKFEEQVRAERPGIPTLNNAELVAEAEPGTRPARRLNIGVIAADPDTAPGFVEHLSQRLSSIADVPPAMWAAHPGVTDTASYSLPAPSLPSVIRRGLKPLVAAPSVVGQVGGLIERTLLAGNFARMVRLDPEVRSLVQKSDVIVAADDVAIRAVWALRGSTDAELVHGPAALVHAFRRASGR